VAFHAISLLFCLFFSLPSLLQRASKFALPPTSQCVCEWNIAGCMQHEWGKKGVEQLTGSNEEGCEWSART
jgi:hypothetical protein